MKTNKEKKALLITLLSVAAFVLFNVYDIFIDPPAWWRFDRQRDKRAILEYVEKNYPTNIKRKGGSFPLQAPAGPFKESILSFELDGVDFSISAWEGKITGDTFYEAKAEKYIHENFVDKFMNERKISPEIKISFVFPPSYYGAIRKDILGDIYAFTGSIHVTITQPHIDEASAPKEVGWFYDFYQYWIENCDLPNCAVFLHYRRNNDYATIENDYVVEFKRGEKTFSSESDFYDHFTT